MIRDENVGNVEELKTITAEEDGSLASRYVCGKVEPANDVWLEEREIQ